MSVKEKYIAALNDEQAKMVSYVKQMTAKVTFPETAVTTNYIKPAKHTVASGICLAGGVLIVRYLMDDTIHTADDMEKYFDIVPLAVIPDVSELAPEKQQKKGKLEKGFSK